MNIIILDMYKSPGYIGINERAFPLVCGRSAWWCLNGTVSICESRAGVSERYVFGREQVRCETRCHLPQKIRNVTTIFRNHDRIFTNMMCTMWPIEWTTDPIYLLIGIIWWGDPRGRNTQFDEPFHLSCYIARVTRKNFAVCVWERDDVIALEC